MSFADDFQEMVAPDLHELMRKRGLFLALDMISFQEAHTDVMALAVQRGALHLADDDLLALEDWITLTLLKQCEKFEPAVARSAEVADKVATDIRRWEAKCLVRETGAPDSTNQNQSQNSPST
jgi:hypothetical protein